MLTARKSRWFDTVFRAYNRNLLRRRFDALWARDIESLAPADVPKIVFANHSSWWDGLVCYELMRRAGADLFVMMEEKNLRRYPLFRLLGAFSVDRGNARSALESIDYAAALLAGSPSRALLIFPQGKIEPADRRPITFESGIRKIADRVPECRLVPLALSYSFGREFKPDIFARAGEPFPPGTLSASAMAAGLEALLEEQRFAVADGTADEYRRLM